MQSTIKPLNKQIKEARIFHKLSQQDLAMFSGLSIDTIKRLECGLNTNPTIYVLQAISIALNNWQFELFIHEKSLK